jgi:predicted O-methyltransferase YrrM
LLTKAFSKSKSVLEVGSGTGQHALYFAPNMTWLSWQTSDIR